MFAWLVVFVLVEIDQRLLGGDPLGRRQARLVFDSARPIVLLLGGKDKGEDLAPLIAVLDARVRAVICYGAAGVRFADALTAAMQHPERLTLVEGGMDDAVSVAREVVQSGDVLLLSPACSSFDEFRNYEERGARFAALAGEAA